MEKKSGEKKKSPEKKKKSEDPMTKKKEKGGKNEKKKENEKKMEKVVKKSKKEKKKKKKKGRSREILKKDYVMKSCKYEWKVLKRLGSGGFGDVYEVALQKDKTNIVCAMKTEQVGGPPEDMRLKIEVEVLLALRNVKSIHFTNIIDRGKWGKLKFIVMDLVGPSLVDLREDVLEFQEFIPSTAINLSIQTLEAIEQLHSVGWIHRDIKPENFAAGLGYMEDTIFLLDFGIAHPFFEKGTTKMKPARKRRQFIGTKRWTSRAGHDEKEQGRGDDLESWIYMVFDFFDMEEGVPWSQIEDVTVEDLRAMKAKFMEGNHESDKIPFELNDLVKKIDALQYEQCPDYTGYRKMLVSIAKRKGISLTMQPEWVHGKKSSRVAKEAISEKAETKLVSTDDDPKTSQKSPDNPRTQNSPDNAKTQKSPDDQMTKTKLSMKSP